MACQHGLDIPPAAQNLCQAFDPIGIGVCVHPFNAMLHWRMMQHDQNGAFAIMIERVLKPCCPGIAKGTAMQAGLKRV